MFITLLFHFLSILLNSTSDVSKELKLSILPPTIRIANDSTLIRISYTVTNLSERNFILYGIKEPIEIYVEKEETYCNGNATGGLELFIYNEKHAQQIPNIDLSPPDSIDYSVMTPERLKYLFEETDKRFLKNSEVLFKKKSIELIKDLDLKNYHLKKGTYYLVLLYYAGKNISNMVDPLKIEEDKKKHCAGVFQGCLRSNSIKVIVE